MESNHTSACHESPKRAKSTPIWKEIKATTQGPKSKTLKFLAKAGEENWTQLQIVNSVQAIEN